MDKFATARDATHKHIESHEFDSVVVMMHNSTTNHIENWMCINHAEGYGAAQLNEMAAQIADASAASWRSQGKEQEVVQITPRKRIVFVGSEGYDGMMTLGWAGIALPGRKSRAYIWLEFHWSTVGFHTSFYEGTNHEGVRYNSVRLLLGVLGLRVTWDK